MHVGTLIPHFKKGDFDKLFIPLPVRNTQEFIGEWYFRLAEKIELNRRTNETLKAMAHAVFRDWFVDFGPVRRKQAGATDPVEIMGGLTSDRVRAAELARLFPEGFEEDDMPVGWKIKTLAHYADLNPESWSARNAPATVEYLDLSNVKWGVIESADTLTWSEAPSRARRVARSGDTLVGTVRPGNGSYTYIVADGQTASTGFAQLRPKKDIYRDFTYLAATCADNIARLTGLADGGAYPAVKPSVVLATETPIVPDTVMRAFSETVSLLRGLIEHRKVENRTLAETRDYLLPKLMSGEVRVGSSA